MQLIAKKSGYIEPWNHLTNILDVDEEGKEKYTDKYICGYFLLSKFKRK